jgi:hypothetical protein
LSTSSFLNGWYTLFISHRLHYQTQSKNRSSSAIFLRRLSRADIPCPAFCSQTCSFSPRNTICLHHTYFSLNAV